MWSIQSEARGEASLILTSKDGLSHHQTRAGDCTQNQVWQLMSEIDFSPTDPCLRLATIRTQQLEHQGFSRAVTLQLLASVASSPG